MEIVGGDGEMESFEAFYLLLSGKEKAFLHVICKSTLFYLLVIFSFDEWLV